MTRAELVRALRGFADSVEKHPERDVWWKIKAHDTAVRGVVKIYSDAGSEKVSIDIELEDDS